MSKKYEVVISGVSGRFPECENVPQLSEMLNSRLNLVTTENCKWTPGALDVPVPTGKIKNISHFDMTFFGVHGKLRELMDHNICLCMTTSFEAICDAGMSPASVSGSNTAVFMNSMTSESEYAALMKGTTGGHGMLGHSRTMQANRISFSLNLKGPSCALDSTWCGGLQGLVLAQRMIERGYITAALVGGCNAHIFPQVSFHYDRMGMLTSTDKTKSFSDDADGYNRSEACVVLYLQRGEEAKRSYGTVVDVLARNFGSRTGGLADVAESHYKQLIEQIYTRSGVLTSDVGYVELDGCANKNIDAVELNCIGEVLCSNRRRPLLVGSVKSNLGHTEAASSLVSIVKALIALESGTIPPNLHYSLPNSAASHLVDGRIQVVTEPTPFCGNVAGVSNIGLCGTYGHVILKQNSKIKSRIPQLGKLPPDGLPRLVVMSGRDPDAMKQSFLKIKSMPIDEEFVALTHSVFQESIHKHVYRGYTILDENISDNIIVQNYSSGVKRPIWFVFSGMGSQWPGMGSSLMKIPMFARTIEKCQTALKPKGVDILDIITNPNPTTFNSILHSFVGIAAVQLGLVDLLAELGVRPDGIVGHSVGELGCAYADGCLTAEQMILSAYARGKASIESKLIRGKMAAVGLSYEQMKDKIPEGIEIACHNSDENCTLSGPEEMMEAYVEQLRAKGVFAKLVNVSNIAYHSKHISPAAPVLLRYLKQVIPQPTRRTRRWISSSIPECEWDSELAAYSSAEYHTNNLLKPVLFEEAASNIPNDSIVIEIAPHGLLQPILRRSHPSCVNVSLTKRADENGLQFLLNGLGRLYVEGVDIQLSKIYPTVEFPVSRNTAPINHLVTWYQPEDVEFFLSKKLSAPCSYTIIYNQKKEAESFTECKIFDNTFIPRAALLNSVFELLSLNDIQGTGDAPIILKRAKFLKDVQVKENIENILCHIPKGASEFELSKDGELILSGEISFADNDYKFYNTDNIEMGAILKVWTHDEFYRYMKSIGIEYGNRFSNIKELSVAENGLMAKVIWKEDWFLFIDALFQIISFSSSSEHNKLRLVTSIGNGIINYNKFNPQNSDVNVYYVANMQMLCCNGIQLNRVETNGHNAREPKKIPFKYEKLKYVPYVNCRIQELYEFLMMCGQLMLENVINDEHSYHTNINIIQLGKQDKYTKILSDLLCQNENIKVKVTVLAQDMELSDNKINKLSQECCLIIAETSLPRTCKTLLQNTKEAFILSNTSPNTIPCDCKTALILQYYSAEFNISFRKKVVPSKMLRKHFISISKENYEEELLSALSCINQNIESCTYIVGNYDNETIIYKTIQKCDQISVSPLLRFVFINSECPEFSFMNTFYSSQLDKDLKVNIYKDGAWGSLRSIPYLGKKDVIEDKILQLTELEGCETDVEYLAVKLQDSCKTRLIGNKLGILEYSGCDKNGHNVFGLCSLKATNVLLEDPILTWKKPIKWTQQQAAAVPLSYCMAVYALHIFQEMKPGDTILIHDGASFISQAVMTIALKIGCKIFVTYQYENEKCQLLSQFPEIQAGNLFNLNSINYAHAINKMTDGKGVKLAFNTLDSKLHFEAALTCVGSKGTFFQINPKTLNNDRKLGLYYFWKESGFIGYNPDCLLSLPASKKKILHTIFKKYLNEGVIQPLSFEINSGPLNSIKAETILKSKVMRSKKLVIKMKSTEVYEESEFFLCKSNESYLIAGNQGEFWLDVILWLLMRGASHIFVGMTNYLSTVCKHRLNCLKAKYPYVQITLLMLKDTSSGLETKNLLEEINSQYPLTTIIVLEMEQKESVKFLDKALREVSSESKFICIGLGEEICDDRHTSGLHGLSISMKTRILNPTYILPMLNSIICDSKHASPVVLLSEYTQEKNTAVMNKISLLEYRYLPSDIHEMEELSYDIKVQTYLEEIPTLCSSYETTKEVPPVFVVPGLKPDGMSKLISRLQHPTFKIKLPELIVDLEAVSREIVEEMNKFHLGIFTIIANDWGSALALHMTKYLESKGKVVLLIMLNLIPYPPQTYATHLLDMHNKLGYRTFNFSPENIPKLNPQSPLGENLKYFCNHCKKYQPKAQIEKGFSIIKNRLIGLLNFSFGGRLTSKVYNIRSKTCKDNTIGLQKYLQAPVKSIIKDVFDAEELLESTKTAETVNCLVLFEYKDSDHSKREDKYIGLNVFTDMKYNSPELMRV